MSDLTDEIETNAEGPKKVAADGLSVEQHSLDEQIRADKYLKEAAAAATTNVAPGLRLFKMRPPGAP